METFEAWSFSAAYQAKATAADWLPPLHWNELGALKDWELTGMPPTYGMALAARVSMPLPNTSIPPSTAGTFSCTNFWAQLVEPSAENSVLHTSSDSGRPWTPPISVLMNSMPALTARLSSGNEPATVLSWLIMPREIGVPVATVGLAGV